MANEELDIVHELAVIRDQEAHSTFSFDYGYFGDAVRANIHSALLKIDEVIGFTPSGGGEIPLPSDVVLEFVQFGFAGVAAIHSPATDSESVVGIMDLENCLTIDDPGFEFEEFDPIEEGE